MQNNSHGLSERARNSITDWRRLQVDDDRVEVLHRTHAHVVQKNLHSLQRAIFYDLKDGAKTVKTTDARGKSAIQTLLGSGRTDSIAQPLSTGIKFGYDGNAWVKSSQASGTAAPKIIFGGYFGNGEAVVSRVRDLIAAQYSGPDSRLQEVDTATAWNIAKILLSTVKGLEGESTEVEEKRSYTEGSYHGGEAGLMKSSRITDNSKTEISAGVLKGGLDFTGANLELTGISGESSGDVSFFSETLRERTS